jgi:hypothetical protein
MHADGHPDAIFSTMNPPFVEILETLSYVCRSCAERFEAAAAGCHNEESHELFVERAEQFGNYAWDLREEISRFGNDRFLERSRTVMLDEDASAKSDKFVGPKNENEASESCLHCVEKAETEYRRAMEDRAMVDPIKKLLRRHHSEIQEAMEA